MTIILVISSAARERAPAPESSPNFADDRAHGPLRRVSDGMFPPSGNVYPIAKACASMIAASILLRSCLVCRPAILFIGRPNFFATPLTGRPEVRKFLRDSVAVRCATPHYTRAAKDSCGLRLVPSERSSAMASAVVTQRGSSPAARLGPFGRQWPTSGPSGARSRDRLPGCCRVAR